MIRQAVDSIYKDIKALQEELKEIQDNCKHEKSEMRDFMWRIGAVEKAKICCECDKVLESPFGGLDQNIRFTTSS